MSITATTVFKELIAEPIDDQDSIEVDLAA